MAGNINWNQHHSDARNNFSNWLNQARTNYGSKGGNSRARAILQDDTVKGDPGKYAEAQMRDFFNAAPQVSSAYRRQMESQAAQRLAEWQMGQMARGQDSTDLTGFADGMFGPDGWMQHGVAQTGTPGLGYLSADQAQQTWNQVLARMNSGNLTGADQKNFQQFKDIYGNPDPKAWTALYLSSIASGNPYYARVVAPQLNYLLQDLDTAYGGDPTQTWMDWYNNNFKKLFGY